MKIKLNIPKSSRTGRVRLQAIVVIEIQDQYNLENSKVDDIRRSLNDDIKTLKPDKNGVMYLLAPDSNTKIKVYKV